MIKRTIAIALLASLLLITPIAGTVYAQTPLPSTGVCTAEITERLSREQRIYRTVIFGQDTAEDAKPGAVRYDTEGNAWIKNGENEWRSGAQGFQGVTWTDLQMDGQSQTPIRRGTFETRKVLTSEIIPTLIQSVRALRCRIATVCENVRLSTESAGLGESARFAIKIPGCIAFEEKPLLSCQFAAENAEDTTREHRGSEVTVRSYCTSVGMQLWQREVELLKLAVSYDAAYRSLLQFAGNFDQFIREFRVSLLTPIRQAISLLGQLHRIPCFIAQCDE
jgi:hypothetical protein